jgi:hypothetical protein
MRLSGLMGGICPSANQMLEQVAPDKIGLYREYRLGEGDINLETMPVYTSLFSEKDGAKMADAMVIGDAEQMRKIQLESKLKPEDKRRIRGLIKSREQMILKGEGF